MTMMIPLPGAYNGQNDLADLVDTLFPAPSPAKKVMLKKIAIVYKNGQSIISLAAYVPSGENTYTRYDIGDLYNPQVTGIAYRGEDLARIYRGDVSKLFKLDIQAATDAAEAGTWSDVSLVGYPTARMSSDSTTPATHIYTFTGTSVILEYLMLRNSGVISVELFDSGAGSVGDAYYNSALELADGVHLLDMYGLPAVPLTDSTKRIMLAENLPPDTYTLALTVRPQRTHDLFARTITALSRVSNVVTATVTADSDPNHALATGNTVVITGADVSSFNGTFVLASGGATSVTFNQVAADETATVGSATKIDVGTRFYDRGIRVNTGEAPDIDVDDDFDDETVIAKYMLETGNKEFAEMVRPVGGGKLDWVYAGGTHGRGLRVGADTEYDIFAIANNVDGDMTAAYHAADIGTTWKRESFTITTTCRLKLTDDITECAEVLYTHAIDQIGVTTTVQHTALIDYERKQLFAPALHLRNRGSKTSTAAGGGFDLFAVDGQSSYQMSHNRTPATGDEVAYPGASLGVLAWNDDYAWLCAVTEASYATLLTKFPALKTQINSRTDGFSTKWYLILYDSYAGTTVNTDDTFTVVTRYSSYDLGATNLGAYLRPLTAFDDALSVPHNTPTDGIFYAANGSVESVFTYDVVTQPLLGTVSINAGAYVYTPSSDVYGTDTFTFRAYDGVGYSNTATVTVTIAAAVASVMNSAYDIETDDLLFRFYADLDADGVAETLRYNSVTRVPDLSVSTGGRALRTVRLETLNGDALLWQRSRAGYADRRVPGIFSLSWPAADEGLLQVTEEAYMTGQLVSIRLDHRWRQLRVVSSEAADLTVNVASGYLLLDKDTYWLRAITAVVCGESDTVVYATPDDGVLEVASGTSVPSGSVLLARISVDAGVITVTSAETGVANARSGYIAEWEAEPAGSNYTSLRVLIHERRA